MEKKCSKCSVVKPLDLFAPVGDGTGRVRGHCRECHRAMERARYGVRTKAGVWTAAEDASIADHYPSGGAAACLPFMPSRTIAAIQQRARRLGFLLSSEMPWPLPQQESAADHLLFQRTPVPVFASALVPAV